MNARTQTAEKIFNSIIKFTDKHNFNPGERPFENGDVIQPEEVVCKIPELKEGERVVLNAWGGWEVHHYEGCRRRLGVYSIETVEGGEARSGKLYKRYLLREEEKFSESYLVEALLSGNTLQTQNKIRGLRYLSLNK